MPKLFLNLSFDHELSLGGVLTTYERNLFAPTRAILDLADDLEVPVTLFTDVLCGLRFREWDREGFSDAYEDQLREACRRGHDVQLHLHPHWLDTVHENGRFHPSSRYSLHAFRDERPPDDIDGIVRRGVDFLREVCGTADSAYRCLAYRAGGFAIAPSTDAILAALSRHGIRIDSSVAPGYTIDSQVNTVDFSRVPESPNWWVAPGTPLDTPADPDADGALFEVPVVTSPRNPANNLPALALRALRRDRAPGPDGVTLYDVGSSKLEKFKRLFPFSTWMLSFDLYWADGNYLLRILDRHLRRYRGSDGPLFLSALSHPKSMGPGGLAVMRQFVEGARRRFGSDVGFVSFPEIDRRVRAGRGLR
jgi:hypothetical protein